MLTAGRRIIRALWGRALWLGLGLIALVSASAGVARAQGVEALGTRALGMGGAFVAVADDASATYWNPAGLATGAIFSTVFEYQTYETGDKDQPFGDLQGGASGLLAVAAPPVGVSYYRLRSSRLHAPGPAAPTDGALGSASELVTHHTGLTVLQSVGSFLHLGTTLKYVRGEAILLDRTTEMAGRDALGDISRAAGRASGAFDLDIGAMAVFNSLRAGVVVRNATEPGFDTPSVRGRVETLRLQRQVRAGVAWLGTRDTVVSADVDLTTTDTELGERRHVAVGAERWFARRRLAVRGGLRVNTLSDAQPVGSGGLSIGITPSIFVDSFISRGASTADRAWGVSGRVTF